MRQQIALPLLVSLLAGCTVGPNYGGPPAAAPRAATAGHFVRAADAAVSPASPSGHWWEGLNDPVLDGLIAKALEANTNAQIAVAKLRQARAALNLQRANGAPNLSASALYAHAHLPGSLGGGSGGSGSNSGGNGSTDLNLYNVGFDASWEIDLFGGQRRAVESARATAQAAEASLADAQVSLSAEVAQAYVNLRERQHRIALNSDALAKQRQMLDLTRQRFDRGTASALDVSRIEADYNGTRSQATPLNAERDAYMNALAVLTGEEPGAVDSDLASPAPIPLPPAVVPIGDPAALLQRRPDIRAAERTLAADTAKIGQAEAARFPRLSFMGLIGIGGTSLSALSHVDDVAAIAAPQLSWSFLDFGRNKAKVRQAEALRDEAEARYRGTVLGALQNAEDSLSRFHYRRLTVAQLLASKAIADHAAALMSQRYVAGTATLIDLLDSQRQQNAAAQNLLSAQAALTGDFIAIQKALGLGWDTPVSTAIRP